MKNTVKKLSKFITSRMFYLLIGLFLSVAIVAVYAALPTVSPGDTLTSAAWNELINTVNEGVIPAGFCIFSRTQTGCPSGWTREAGFDGRTIRGAAAPGGAGGSDSHSHTMSHTHQVTPKDKREKPSASYYGSLGWASTDSVNSGGPSTANTGGAFSWPPYSDVLICCKP